MNKIFAFLQGRHTAFATAFFIMGNALQWCHRLDATWIAFMTALMGFVLGHSYKEDKSSDEQSNNQPPTQK